MSVTVSTQRHAAASGQSQLDVLLPNVAAASELLGLNVQGVQLLAQAPGSGQSVSQLTSDSDPYTPAYDAAERSGSNSPIEEAVAGLPVAAIIAIAVAVLVLMGAVGSGLWFRRRQSFAKMREQAVNGKIVGKVEEFPEVHKPAAGTSDADVQKIEVTI